MRYVLAAWLLMVGTSTPFSVRATPQTFMAPHDVEVTCRIPPQPNNVLLRVGIENVDASERDMHGTFEPPTWPPITFRDVGCEAGPAFCEVYRRDGSHGRVWTPLQVAGCES